MRQGEAGDGEVQALRAAFEALLPLADPPRQVKVLRAALQALIRDEDPGSQISPSIAKSRLRYQRKHQISVDLTPCIPWWELRDRVRTVMEDDSLTTAEVAAMIGITRPHLTRIMCRLEANRGQRSSSRSTAG